MKLPNSKWIELLSKEHSPGIEKVIIVVGKLPRILKIRKDDWQNHFSGFDGFEFRQGKEIEIVPGADGDSKVVVPDWARERLASGASDAICITQRDRRYYLKKLQLVEQPADFPACIVVDSFEADRVERIYWNRTDLDDITYDAIDRLLSSMPRFRYDPVAHFKEMDGRLGLLGRREFLGGFTRTDKSILDEYKKGICQDQEEDGSWQQSAAHTAFRLIRLLEVGATMQEAPVEKAANWLLKAKEPLGFPGLFMFSEKTADSFNAWKANQEPGSNKRGSRTSSMGQRQVFLENRDVYGVSNSFCELKLTWSTGIALEALLRCGLHEEKRVVKAINTLLAMSRGSGGWCGCGYFVASIRHPESIKQIDFNSCAIQVRGRDVGSVGVERRDILELVCNHDCKGLAFEEGKTLTTRIGHEGSGDCAMAIHRALAFHPAYHGSNLETMAAILCSHRQGWLGDWTGNYISFFFSLLARVRCPLSAYLVLRTVPLLVRQQRSDGFWQEEELPHDPKKPLPASAKEESTFMILTALKAFGFLDALMPA